MTDTQQFLALLNTGHPGSITSTSGAELAEFYDRRLRESRKWRSASSATPFTAQPIGLLKSLLNRI